MPTCFVIQPFDDGGAFDKRFDDVIGPAIQDAGLEPYRVDRDAAAQRPVEAISAQIESAAVCLADISRDNPNVWYEVGLAEGCQTNVVLICDRQARPSFPFDVAHRRIVRYRTESPRDFVDMRGKIAESLAAAAKEPRPAASANARCYEPTGCLNEYETACVVAMAHATSGPDGPVAAWNLEERMRRAGHTPGETNLAVRTLLAAGLMDTGLEADPMNGYEYRVYRLTEPGWDWARQNDHLLAGAHRSEMEERDPFADE